MAQLVAHRGQCASLPENTLESVGKAIACGATAVEFDLQMSADFVPLLSHDISLLRTAGVDIDIASCHSSEIVGISVAESERFDEPLFDITLPSLQQMVTLLLEAPQVTAFVELKNESIEVFGTERFVHQVLAELQPIKERCVVIADSIEALREIQRRDTLPVGWIVHRWDECDRGRAQQDALDYLIINHKYCLPSYDFAADPWEWMVYETSDPELANVLIAQGIHFVETNDICSMLQHLPEYRTGG